MQLVELYSSKQLKLKSQSGEDGDKVSQDKVTSIYCQCSDHVIVVCISQAKLAALFMEEK